MEKDFTINLIHRCRDRSGSMDEAVQKATRTLTGVYLLTKKKAEEEIARAIRTMEASNRSRRAIAPRAPRR